LELFCWLGSEGQIVELLHSYFPISTGLHQGEDFVGTAAYPEGRVISQLEELVHVGLVKYGGGPGGEIRRDVGQVIIIRLAWPTPFPSTNPRAPNIRPWLSLS
jgi:hypothetical protein